MSPESDINLAVFVDETKKTIYLMWEGRRKLIGKCQLMGIFIKRLYNKSTVYCVEERCQSNVSDPSKQNLGLFMVSK